MILGITGRSGVGKSTAIQYLGDWDFHHIDLDQLGHQAQQDQTIKDQLVNRFGTGIVMDHQINRAALGEIVFADSQALLDLNQIVHPWMKGQVRIQLDKYAQKELIVIQGALIDEIGLRPFCDELLLIEADPLRILESSGERAIRIGKSQRSIESYTAQATHIIHNDFTDRFAVAVTDYVRSIMRS